MERSIQIAFVGVIAVMFACVLSVTLDNVGQYQLDTMYNCKIAYSERQHRAYCRHENNGFGNMVDLRSRYPLVEDDPELN